MSRLTKTILYAFYFVAVIALGAVIVMSFTDKHSTKQPKSLANKPSTSQTSSTTGTGSSSKSTTKSTTASSSSTTQTAVASTPAPAPTSTQTLSNTGPGNYVALFIGATVLGTFIYHRRQISRSKQAQ